MGARCDRLHLPGQEKQSRNVIKVSHKVFCVKMTQKRGDFFVWGVPHHGHVHGVSVGVAVHGHGADAHLLGGAHDAASDLPSVGDQHLLDPSHCWTVNKQAAKTCSTFSRNDLPKVTFEKEEEKKKKSFPL